MLCVIIVNSSSISHRSTTDNVFLVLDIDFLSNLHPLFLKQYIVHLNLIYQVPILFNNSIVLLLYRVQYIFSNTHKLT